MKISKDQMNALLPHQGNMQLLDGVVDYDVEHIVCIASGHCHTDNPLRSNDSLPAIIGLEYAAQAMAVHASLISSHSETSPKGGYLATASDIHLQSSRLDVFNCALTIEATRLASSPMGFSYGFTLSAEGKILINGQASVIKA